MLWYDDVLMKGSCEKYVRGYNESELDVDEDNVCKQSRREGNMIHITNVRLRSIILY